MQNSFYFLSCVASLCALWLVWSLGIKRLALDALRERLFELRFSLFRLGMSGELSFDSDTYRIIETLICGLLRFGHRISLLTYAFSSVEFERAKKRKDFTDVSQLIALKLSRLKPETQGKLAAILRDLRTAVVLYMGLTSLFCLAYLVALAIGRLLGIRRTDEVKERVAIVIEREAYRSETRRSLGIVPA